LLAVTVSAVAAVAVCTGELPSLTATVKLAVPVVVGVPEITPALDIVRPAGSDPELMLQTYPGVPPLALSVALNAVPACALPSAAEAIVSLLAPTLIETTAVCICPGTALSFTATVKVEVPFVVGVPEITPALESVRPAGRLPEGSVHVYPGVPPVAESDALYAVPACAAASDAELIVSLLAATSIDTLALCVCTGDPLSRTATVKLLVPLAVGVPEITPALESVSPAGRLPEATVHVYPADPPVALTGAV
jgi:hypothetical protein